MQYFKNILFVLVAFLAINGVGCGIGYMVAAKAPFINILGLIIAVIPAGLVVYYFFKKDTEAPVVKGRK